MRRSGAYEIPDEILRQPHSPAFASFLQHWFGDSRALTRGDVDLVFLNALTPEERAIAKDLVRRNLPLKYAHVIEGVAALGDLTAVPVLRAMLASEPDASRQLTIAGVLWKLVHDEAFVECLLPYEVERPHGAEARTFPSDSVARGRTRDRFPHRLPG